MKTRIFGICAVIAWSGVAVAQPRDQVENTLNQRIAAWQAQVDAAERDIALVDDVSRAFYGARHSESADAFAVDATLDPLRAVLPDYRLRYQSAADHCRVVRMLMSARSTAGSRAIAGLAEIIRLSTVTQLYAATKMHFGIERLRGQTPSEETVARAFAQVLASEETVNPVHNFSGMDYLSSDMANECH